MSNGLRKWTARWIAAPGADLGSWNKPVLPAPHFRRVLTLASAGQPAAVRLCGLGYYELYVNGQRVGEQVLDPVVTQYDKRALYVTHDVTGLLRHGENVIGVILGNGWYNCHTPEVWHFDKASWRDYPKLLLELEVDGRIVLASDAAWKCTRAGPIVFDGLRNGEHYDARLELDGWLEAGYDDSGWKSAVQAAPPGGVLEPQLMPPCKVMRTLPAVDAWTLESGETVYDLGQNIAGWVRLRVSGLRGTEITLRYGERLKDRALDQDHIACFIKDGDCQTDRYILKGGGEVETWEPRFAYHGFQYVSICGEAKIHSVEGRVVHTAFPRAGQFSCSDPTLDKLQANTVWSYLGNFVGIPTDCPHREKNGWTGDALLAAETGLFNFAAGSAYAQWIASLTDAQRPSGQLPGIVPTAGWGYNWGSGPAWDSALILIPWYVYLYTGDASAIRAHYGAMKSYLDYCGSRAEEHILSFGLGDWSHPDGQRMADVAITSTGYYYADAVMLARFARILGRETEAGRFERLAAAIRRAFNRRFYRGDGIYGQGEPTALGCALHQGLVEESERGAVARRLAETVQANGGKADFGILGAKYIPRVLAENGYAALALRILTQPEYPGWAHWLRQGANTLWECWSGDASHNHIMFGDISAWMYQYLAGLTPDPEQPGFWHTIIRPHAVEGVDWVKAWHESPRGRIEVAWRRRAAQFELDVTIPATSTATVELPVGTEAVTVDGRPAAEVTGLASRGVRHGRPVYQVASGNYQFTAAESTKKN